jgi:hypothetical protein
MDNNSAYAYLVDENYTSIYVVLNGFEQLIFYWNLKEDCEKRKPKWRATKETVQEGMKILSYNKFGCLLDVNGKFAQFEWYEYDRDIKNNKGPNHKGKLVNFAEWRLEPAHKDSSPIEGNRYPGYYSGNYSQPQPYEDD